MPFPEGPECPSMEGDPRVASPLWAARWSVFHLGAPVLVCFSDGGVSASTPGLVAIKDAHDIETRLNEVEKLLKAIISMPRKVGVRARGAGCWVGRWGGRHPPGGVEDGAEPGAKERVPPWALGAPVFSPPGRSGSRGLTVYWKVRGTCVKRRRSPGPRCSHGPHPACPGPRAPQAPDRGAGTWPMPSCQQEERV